MTLQVAMTVWQVGEAVGMQAEAESARATLQVDCTAVCTVESSLCSPSCCHWPSRRVSSLGTLIIRIVGRSNG
jgi:hypothetical protein